MSRRTSHQTQQVFVEIKQNGITNDITTWVAGHKLLCLIDSEIFETIYSTVGKQLECIGAFHVEVRHVVRLVEKSASFAPGSLFISPVRELRTDNRKGI